MAEVLISQALALVDGMRMGEGVEVLEGTVLPLLQAAVGAAHPLCIYAQVRYPTCFPGRPHSAHPSLFLPPQGCVGLGLTIASMAAPSASFDDGNGSFYDPAAGPGPAPVPGGMMEGSDASPLALHASATAIDERGQLLMYEALAALDAYPLRCACPLPPARPPAWAWAARPSPAPHPPLARRCPAWTPLRSPFGDTHPWVL